MSIPDKEASTHGGIRADRHERSWCALISLLFGDERAFAAGTITVAFATARYSCNVAEVSRGIESEWNSIVFPLQHRHFQPAG